MSSPSASTRPPPYGFNEAVEAGVSTFGILLLVAVTVTVAAAPMVLLKLDQGGDDLVASGVQSQIAKGSGGWGDGDERVEIHYRGGRVMEAANVEVHLEVDGATEVVSGRAGSADGERFATAATPWKYETTIPPRADVEVTVVWQKLMTEHQVSRDLLTAPSGPAGGGGVGHGNGGSGGAGHGDDHDHDEDMDEDKDEEEGSRVEICHIPPGNPEARHTIKVGAGAVDAHLAHGDHRGPCEEDEANPDRAPKRRRET